MRATARWLPLAWAVLWVGGAVYQALPGQNTNSGGADPRARSGSLGRLDASVASWTMHHGTTVVVALVVFAVLIGLAALYSRVRSLAVAAGFVLVLLAIALLGGRPALPDARVGARRMHNTGLVARRDLREGSAARP